MTALRRQLHIFPTFALGGAQRRFIQLATQIPGWHHVIVSLSGDKDAQKSLPAHVSHTMECIEVKPSKLLSLQNIRAFSKMFRNVEPDLLCTYNWGSIEAALANRLGRRMPHLHFEDGFGPEEATRTLPQRNLFRRCVLTGKVHVVVPSWGLKTIAAQRWGIPPARLHFLPNGVDLKRFSPTPHTPSDTPSPLTIGSVGALRPEKNFSRLINVVSALNGKVSLTIVGNGPQYAHLQELASKSSREVIFAGAIEDPSSAYRCFDIFALTSDTEQMPLTILEAMASGLPIVATDVGDIKTMVSKENQEFIVPPTDENQLTAALNQLIEDAALRNSIGEANRQVAEARFGEAKMRADYAALFDRVTGVKQQLHHLHQQG